MLIYKIFLLKEDFDGTSVVFRDGHVKSITTALAVREHSCVDLVFRDAQSLQALLELITDLSALGKHEICWSSQLGNL